MAVAVFGESLRGFQYDDAFITYRYAANLGSAEGLVFNPGEYVAGASSTFHVLALGVFWAIGITNLPLVSGVIGIFSGVALLWLIGSSAMKAKMSLLPVLAIILPFSTLGFVSYWAVSGMETTMFAALVLALVVSYDRGNKYTTLAIATALVLTRMEGIILPMSIIAADFTVHRRLRYPARQLLTWSLLAFGVWALWMKLYYGEFAPSGVQFKSLVDYYNPDDVENFVAYGRFFVTKLGVLGTLGGVWSVLVVGFTARRLAVLNKEPEHEGGRYGIFSPHVDLAIAIYLLVSIAMLVLGPSSDLNRYATHLYALLALNSIALIAYLLNRYSNYLDRWHVVLLVAAICVIGLVSSVRNTHMVKTNESLWSEHAEQRRRTAEWIEANVPSGTSVVSSDVGVVGFTLLDHHVIDVVGLTSNEAYEAASNNTFEDFTLGLREKGVIWIVDTRAPDGRIQAVRILDSPQEIFGSYRYSNDWVSLSDLADVVEVFTSDITTTGHSFVVARIDWK